MLEQARASMHEHPALWIGVAIGGATLVVVFLAYRNQSGAALTTTNQPGNLINPYPQGDQGLSALLANISQQWGQFMSQATSGGTTSGGTPGGGGQQVPGVDTGVEQHIIQQHRGLSFAQWLYQFRLGGASSAGGIAANMHNISIDPQLSASQKTQLENLYGGGPGHRPGTGGSLSALPGHFPAIVGGGPFDMSGTHHAITEAPQAHDLLR